MNQRTTAQIHEEASKIAGVNPRGSIQMCSGELAAVVRAAREAMASQPVDDVLGGFIAEYSFAFEHVASTVIVVSTAKVLAMTNAIHGVTATVSDPQTGSRRSRRRDRNETRSETNEPTNTETESEPDGETTI